MSALAANMPAACSAMSRPQIAASSSAYTRSVSGGMVQQWFASWMRDRWDSGKHIHVLVSCHKPNPTLTSALFVKNQSTAYTQYTRSFRPVVVGLRNSKESESMHDNIRAAIGSVGVLFTAFMRAYKMLPALQRTRMSISSGSAVVKPAILW